MTDFSNSISFQMAKDSGRFERKGNFLRSKVGSGVAEYFGHSGTSSHTGYIQPANNKNTIAIKIGNTKHTLDELSKCLGYDIESYKKNPSKEELVLWVSHRSKYLKDIFENHPDLLEKKLITRWKYPVDGESVPATYFNYPDSKSYICYPDKKDPDGKNLTKNGTLKDGIDRKPSSSRKPWYYLNAKKYQKHKIGVIVDSPKGALVFIEAGFPLSIGLSGAGNLTDRQADFLISELGCKRFIIVPDNNDRERMLAHKLGTKLSKFGANEILYFNFGKNKDNKINYDETDFLNEKGISAIKDIPKNCENTISYETVPDKETEKKLKILLFDGFFDTQDGNLDRFLTENGKDIFYVHHWNKWFLWDGIRWVLDDCGKIFSKSRNTIKDLFTKISDIKNSDERTIFFNFFKKSSKNLEYKAIVEMAKHESPVLWQDLENNNHLIAAKNAIIDLKTGLQVEAQRKQLITKAVNAEYNRKAPRKKFEAFLDKIFEGNLDLIEYIQVILGYAMTGETSERKVFVFFGPQARNGKTTLVETILDVMGDYGAQLPFESFLIRDSNAIRNDIASLVNIRFVTTSEPPENKPMNESLLKLMAGGSHVSARFMRAEFFSYLPNFTIFIDSNPYPAVTGDDEGLWDKLVIIPFDYRFSQDEIVRDYKFQLLEERDGIFNWLIEGSVKWYENMFDVPDVVKKSTESFRKEQDIFKRFLDECTLVNRGNDHYCLVKDMKTCFENWISRNEEGFPQPPKFIKKRMRENGFGEPYQKKIDGKNMKVWQGISLNESALKLISGDVSFLDTDNYKSTDIFDDK